MCERRREALPGDKKTLSPQLHGCLFAIARLNARTHLHFHSLTSAIHFYIYLRCAASSFLLHTTATRTYRSAVQPFNKLRPRGFPKMANQFLNSHAKPYVDDYNHANASVAGIDVIQYRSYLRDLQIYHLRLHLLPLPMVYRALQSQKGYLDKLKSFDPILQFPVVGGDEIPPNCIEAIYTPNIFRSHGSALALRSNRNTGEVEWFVFDGAIHDSVLAQMLCIHGRWSLQSDLDADDPRKVFDLVGYVQKGVSTRTVRGANPEHKGWHESLSNATEVKLSLTLTWKTYWSELKAEQERLRQNPTAASENTQEQEQDDDFETSESAILP